MSLEDTLATLKKYGLLDRTEALKVGDITVTMGAPETPSVPGELPPVSRAEEEAAVREAMYGAAAGYVPEVS